MNDPLPDIFYAPLKSYKKAKKVTVTRAIIPGLSLEEEREYIKEIRNMGDNIVPWKQFPNGMTASEFAYIYVCHFKRTRGICGLK